jgi:hypothetical protein
MSGQAFGNLESALTGGTSDEFDHGGFYSRSIRFGVVASVRIMKGGNDLYRISQLFFTAPPRIATRQRDRPLCDFAPLSN